MSIENDIQQTKFRNEYHKVSVNLIYTSNWLMEKNKQFFDNADITPQQFNILRILRGAGTPLSTLQIRQRMLDKMSDTSRIVDRLVKKELVKKVICKTDRRLVDVTITEKGLSLLEGLDGFNHDMDASVGNLTEEEAVILNGLLDKMRGS
ncbi:MarR family transcriptional regulator [Pseudoflavitalea sp. X16]|uniref:MarR family winged helix-turn-helix transcriptional regulator n=1 Tax=Paraflavitalea devenefica TaxID=2716334 RepID=UPI00141F1161|nr:MarR family transcriptional regulator [Paraflavitalea devenefica]NII24408.1 MarR family transcriptional regulator [Paraflavitalea devenefica]